MIIIKVHHVPIIFVHSYIEIVHSTVQFPHACTQTPIHMLYNIHIMIETYSPFHVFFSLMNRSFYTSHKSSTLTTFVLPSFPFADTCIFSLSKLLQIILNAFWYAQRRIHRHKHTKARFTETINWKSRAFAPIRRNSTRRSATLNLKRTCTISRKIF